MKIRTNIEKENDKTKDIKDIKDIFREYVHAVTAKERKKLENNDQYDIINKELGKIYKVNTTLANSLKVIIYELTKKEYKIDTDDVKYTKNSVVVLLKNTDSHNYDIHVPVLIVNDSRAVRPNGTIGNNLPIDKESIRIGTEKEVDELLDKLYAVGWTP